MFFLNAFVGKELFSNPSEFLSALDRYDAIPELYSWFTTPEDTHRGVTLTYNLFDEYRGWT